MQLAQAASSGPGDATVQRESNRGLYALLAITALVLMIVLHLTGGGLRGH